MEQVISFNGDKTKIINNILNRSFQSPLMFNTIACNYCGEDLKCVNEKCCESIFNQEECPYDTSNTCCLN